MSRTEAGGPDCGNHRFEGFADDERVSFTNERLLISPESSRKARDIDRNVFAAATPGPSRSRPSERAGDPTLPSGTTTGPLLPPAAQVRRTAGPSSDDTSRLEVDVSIKPRKKLLSPMYMCALAALAATLAVVPRATPASSPLLALGPITIANGTAALTGTLGPQVSGATLTVNGQPLGVDAAGNFAGVVDLNGTTALDLAISGPTGAQTSFQIPLTGLAVIPGSVLDSVVNAGLSVLNSVGANGQPVTVSGSVLDTSQLVGLSVNGVDVLQAVDSGGTFHVSLPPTTRTVTVTVSGANGTSETVVQPVFKPFAVTTVSARNARGLKITKIRYVRNGVRRTHRLRMIVTVKDSRGLLVRGATILVQARAHRLAKRPRIARSGPQGRATIVLRLRRSAFGKRMFTVTLARTPSAKARRTTSVRVPRTHR
jgi:hypothetical protein